MLKNMKIILLMTSCLLLSACGNNEQTNEIYYKNYEVYDKSTHTDKYETINSTQNNEQPTIIIDETLSNWTEPEDNGVVALSYYEVMKKDLGVTDIHNSEHYTDVAFIQNGYAVNTINALGDYFENIYAASAIYEKATSIEAEYIDTLNIEDMGDGTYVIEIDFGKEIATLYFTESEAFID